MNPKSSAVPTSIGILCFYINMFDKTKYNTVILFAATGKQTRPNFKRGALSHKCTCHVTLGSFLILLCLLPIILKMF